jgi:protein-S-isoprenylcysteine O-methyltransferase Ste14
MKKLLKRIYPPVWLLLGLLLMVTLHIWWPWATLSTPLRWVPGSLLLVAGVAMAAVAAAGFKRAGTDVVPFKNVTTRVTGGLYNYSRNPMYLGLVLVLSGCAMLLGSVSPFLVIPLFMWIIRRNFIQPEEAMLQQLFGDQYRQFCQRVRRWV